MWMNWWEWVEYSCAVNQCLGTPVGYTWEQVPLEPNPIEWVGWWFIPVGFSGICTLYSGGPFHYTEHASSSWARWCSRSLNHLLADWKPFVNLTLQKSTEALYTKFLWCSRLEERWKLARDPALSSITKHFWQRRGRNTRPQLAHNCGA